VWAELSVLAHLTGWTVPMPGPVFAGALAAMEHRLRDCSVSHAVDAAVAARIPVISARLSGPGLAVHVVAAMRAALDEDRWLCDQQEPRWLAPPYRWALVLDSLRALHRRDPVDLPVLQQSTSQTCRQAKDKLHNKEGRDPLHRGHPTRP